LAEPNEPRVSVPRPANIRYADDPPSVADAGEDILQHEAMLRLCKLSDAFRTSVAEWKKQHYRDTPGGHNTGKFGEESFANLAETIDGVTVERLYLDHKRKGSCDNILAVGRYRYRVEVKSWRQGIWGRYGFMVPADQVDGFVEDGVSYPGLAEKADLLVWPCILFPKPLTRDAVLREPQIIVRPGLWTRVSEFMETKRLMLTSSKGNDDTWKYWCPESVVRPWPEFVARCEKHMVRPPVEQETEAS